MITASKCRPRNSAGRLCLTVSPYQIAPSVIATNPPKVQSDFSISGLSGLVQFSEGVEEVADFKLALEHNAVVASVNHKFSSARDGRCRSVNNTLVARLAATVVYRLVH